MKKFLIGLGYIALSSAVAGVNVICAVKGFKDAYDAFENL